MIKELTLKQKLKCIDWCIDQYKIHPDFLCILIRNYIITYTKRRLESINDVKYIFTEILLIKPKKNFLGDMYWSDSTRGNKIRFYKLCELRKIINDKINANN